ncbi:hypothetical protein LSH36_38g07004 [Paralvinella palmiformis]|uniref:GH10 domain-containing protein n=1 Tax=Paralvinella palmiformis TaxID=53620 RepID=A0AAD9NDS1_9ANNE|nr:hypothetical protein LSH36_38g07004 [Paralvinella palmiformis]
MMRLLVVVITGFLALGHRVRAVDVIFGYEDPSQNKFKNWDFESNLSNNDWTVSGATVTKVSGGHTGRSSIKVQNRVAPDGGVKQTVTGLRQNTNYFVSMFVKMLTNAPSGLGYVSFYIMCKSGSVSTLVAKLPFQTTEDTWKHIGGDYKLPSGSSAQCYIRTKPTAVTFQLDSASFIELKKHSNWKSYLDKKIKTLRTSSLRIKGRLPSGCSPSSTTVKVELKRHEFGFGTAIKAREFIGQSQVQVNYRNFILKHFNWAVFENAMKWIYMESSKGHTDYSTIDKAMAILKKNNITIRGHNILWEIMKNNPKWVQKLSGAALKNDALKRVTDMTRRFKNDIAEWDLCNEYLHKHFYELKTQYRDMLISEFQKAHMYDPNAKLFLNDYEIVKKGRMTSAMADLAEYLKKKNAHIGGIGIQSHLKILPMDEEVLEKRLQIVGRVGLPITITELSVHNTNVQTRANALDMALRVYFASPNVHAIILWGFADQFFTFANDFYLTQGTNFTPNTAGQKLLHLIHEEWSTKKDIHPTSSNVDTTISQAFRGTYKLTATCNGNVKIEKEFFLGKNAITVNF